MTSWGADYLIFYITYTYARLYIYPNLKPSTHLKKCFSFKISRRLNDKRIVCNVNSQIGCYAYTGGIPISITSRRKNTLRNYIRIYEICDLHYDENVI